MLFLQRFCNAFSAVIQFFLLGFGLVNFDRLYKASLAPQIGMGITLYLRKREGLRGKYTRREQGEGVFTERELGFVVHLLRGSSHIIVIFELRFSPPNVGVDNSELGNQLFGVFLFFQSFFLILLLRYYLVRISSLLLCVFVCVFLGINMSKSDLSHKKNIC